MIELLQYKDVPYSQWGFQWVVIGEFDTEEQAQKEIENQVRIEGLKRQDFKTRTKVKKRNNPKKIYGGFKMSERAVDMTHSERRERWNSDDPRDLTI